MSTRPEVYIPLYDAKNTRVHHKLNYDVTTRTNLEVRREINGEISNKINSELIKQTK